MGRISKQGPLRQVEPAMPERPTHAGSEIVLYQTEDGQSRIAVHLEDDTVWLTQRQLAGLFQKDVRTVNEHVQNIVDEGEVDPAATTRKFRIVQPEGGREVARAVAHRGPASLSRSSWWCALEQGPESLVSRASPRGWRPPHHQPRRPPHRRQQLRRDGRRPEHGIQGGA